MYIKSKAFTKVCNSNNCFKCNHVRGVFWYIFCIET